MAEPYWDAEMHYANQEKAAERECPQCRGCGEPIEDEECVILDSFDPLGSCYHRDCAVYEFVHRTPHM